MFNVTIDGRAYCGDDCEAGQGVPVAYISRKAAIEAIAHICATWQLVDEPIAIIKAS